MLVLEPLAATALEQVLERALADEVRGLGCAGLQVDDDARRELVGLAAGDARSLLNFVELAALLAASRETKTIDAEMIREAAGKRAILYDKTGEEHYNVVSALIKPIGGTRVCPAAARRTPCG